MSKKADIRGYVNPDATGTSAATQQGAMPPGVEIYVEDKTGKVFDRMLRGLRKGSVVAVYELYCLAPGANKARADKRRRILAERVDAIKANGGKIIETSAKRSPAAMLLHAYDQIATSGRARKRKVIGAPVRWPKPPATRDGYEAIWRRRGLENDAQRHEAIRQKFGVAPSIGWLRREFGSPHK